MPSGLILQVEDDQEAIDNGYEVNEDDTVVVKQDDFLKVCEQTIGCTAGDCFVLSVSLDLYITMVLLLKCSIANELVFDRHCKR